METKREYITKVIKGEETHRVPVGFWHHYLGVADYSNSALEDASLIEKNLSGARKYKEEIDPDFVKIMTDGLFFLPLDFAGIHCAKDLYSLEGVKEDHPWFVKSYELAKGYREIYGEDILIFFNVFSPLTTLNQNLKAEGEGWVSNVNPALDYLNEDAEAVVHALDVIADGLNSLLKKLFDEKIIDGIYLSVSNMNRRIPADLYSKYITPSEAKIIAFANRYSETNMIHICGYDGNKNIISVYSDYDVSVVNWAVYADETSLAEGRKYFPGKTLLAGFGNNQDGILYKGSEEELVAETEKLLAEAGRGKLILGADCTIPKDTPVANINVVKATAAK